MYSMSVWLHITSEVNQNICLLIHFDEGTGGGEEGVVRETSSRVYGHDSQREETFRNSRRKEERGQVKRR